MNKKTLGIVTNDPEAVFQKAVIAGARLIAAQYQYSIQIAQCIGDLPDANGLLIIANVARNDEIRAAHDSGIPISLVAHRVPGTSIPAVFSNNYQGITTLVAHLVTGCKRRKLVFIRGIAEQVDAQEREFAFRQALMRHGLTAPTAHYLPGDFSMETAADSIKNLLASGADFDGVVSADHIMAIAAKNVLQNAGYRIPEDVSIVGYGDGPESELAELTVAAANIVDMGRRAARQILSQMAGTVIRGETILSTKLIIRQTCGYPKELIPHA